MQGLEPQECSRPVLYIRQSLLSEHNPMWKFPFNRGGFVLHREEAQLEIMGNFINATYNWDIYERMCGRRLILCETNHEGPYIRLRYRPIATEDYVEGTTVISCVKWDEREDYYVTSMDIITLIELLINRRLTKGEKNHIRRDIEVCKPTTISSSKEDVAQFFSLVMSFRYPNPRKIVKSIKVFPWSSLEKALRKVVEKHAAVCFNVSELENPSG